VLQPDTLCALCDPDGFRIGIGENDVGEFPSKAVHRRTMWGLSCSLLLFRQCPLWVKS
jgi:hypothetical protein